MLGLIPGEQLCELLASGRQLSPSSSPPLPHPHLCVTGVTGTLLVVSNIHTSESAPQMVSGGWRGELEVMVLTVVLCWADL